MKYLVRNLKKLRKENKLTQHQIATTLNMHRSNYSKVENGERELSIEAIITLADFFGMSVDELVRDPKTFTSKENHLNELLEEKLKAIDTLAPEDKQALYRVIQAMINQS
jgi:transcriptional regulator with XRE-family HTH domain